jgi:hypothetical protein
MASVVTTASKTPNRHLGLSLELLSPSVIPKIMGSPTLMARTIHGKITL